jgi:HSP20 family protein
MAKEFPRIEDIVEKTMERAFGEFFPFSPRRWRRSIREEFPLCDLIDKGDYLLLRAEVPGLKKEDIEISVNNTSINLKGEIKREKEAKGETYYRSERYFGSFSRIIDLPIDVNPDNVEATLRDGVLEVKLPKRKASRAKRIEIKS